MKLLQILAGIAIVFAPYLIIYKKGALKEYSENIALAYHGATFYLIANGAKILLLATGIPELFGMIFGETFIMALINTALPLGMIYPLKTRSQNGMDCYDVILGVSLGWSLIDSTARLLFEALSAKKNKEAALRFVYIAVCCNVNLLASVILATILSLLGRKRIEKMPLYILGAIAAFIFPFLQTYNILLSGDPTMYNFNMLAFQAGAGLLLGLVVEYVYKLHARSD
ncbi:Transmembrane protein 147 [Babesia duncani]|uniref:BOS complex subunit TMEM147 n=1 Tax=Babesia duncani TaxID=323732 RepID=A0AAD9PML2_9APIC|nr:Transmembrane protein 147 [Babesia duncani]